MNYIHIGGPRTATTTLQNEVFPGIKKGVYLGKINNPGGVHYPRELYFQIENHLADLDIESAQEKFKLLVSICQSFPPQGKLGKAYEVANNINRLFLLFDEATSNLKKEYWLYSDEALSFAPCGLRGVMNWAKPVHVLDLLFSEHCEYPSNNITLIITFREPIPYILSFYKKSQELRMKAKMAPYKMKYFLEKQADIANTHFLNSPLSQCLQKRYVEKLKTYCPNVTYTFYENLVKSEDLLRELGLPEEEKISLKNFNKQNNSKDNHYMHNVLKLAYGEMPADTQLLEELDNWLDKSGFGLLIKENLLTISPASSLSHAMLAT